VQKYPQKRTKQKRCGNNQKNKTASKDEGLGGRFSDRHTGSFSAGKSISPIRGGIKSTVKRANQSGQKIIFKQA